MTVWKVTFTRRDGIDGEMFKTFETEGTKEEAENFASNTLKSINQVWDTPYFWRLESLKAKRGGKRPGAGGQGGKPATYGESTKVVRVPASVAHLIPSLIKSLESLDNLTSLYEEKIRESQERSKYGEASPRYEKLEEFLEEIGEEMALIKDINNLRFNRNE